jgi:predicted nucleic acid-binding protein
LPILLDTNVYLFALKSAAGAEFFERRFRPLVFRTHLRTLDRAGRVSTPSFEDWKDAGRLVARVTWREPGRKGKVQQMLNDILLALSARRIGADLFTFNREDFELIRRHKAFSLKVLRPAT